MRFAANLDADTVKKTEAFLGSDLGRRMVAADVALATLDETDDRQGHERRDHRAVARRSAMPCSTKLEARPHSTESTVQIFLSMGTAVAQRDRGRLRNGPRTCRGTRPQIRRGQPRGTGTDMREPMRRYLAYGYRDLSDADLKQLLAFLQSTAGKRYVSAYTASLDAGFNAMGRRCGEQLGESLRELAIAQLATESPNQRRRRKRNRRRIKRTRE